MKRLISVTMLAAFAVGNASAMHGPPMLSSQYFPLIDGARYEYVFASGPRASAVAVMHAGQAWAGATQLTSFHMTAICHPGTPCVQDTTHFFRMDSDGLRYFGGDGRTADHVNYMNTLMNPEWLIKNPVAPGTMMGPGMGYQDADDWHATIAGTHSVLGPQQHTSSYQALALETVTTPAGTFVNALHVREQRGPGNMRDVWYAPGVGMVRWIEGPEEALLANFVRPSGAVAPVARAVEYYHASLDHYFITTHASEIDALDGGQLQGWQRTGLSFNVVAESAVTARDTAAVCRYYGRPDAGLNTHFYSAFTEECSVVGREWSRQWTLESPNVFRVYLPDRTTGVCPAGTLPIYRAWNRRTDVNHRFTIDPNTQAMMTGRGHAAEGFGNPPVAMCSPQ